MSKRSISVSAKALEELLRAVMGPPHHVRELQATRGLPGFDNCIDLLQREFNAAIAAPVVERQESVTLESVAIVREGDDGLYLEWTLEGGFAALECEGLVLFACPEENDLCDENGSAEIYTSPPAPVSVELDEREEFVAWVRREWPQAPLSLVRDLLPKNDPRYGEYCDEALQRAWVGWQARGALAGKS